MGVFNRIVRWGQRKSPWILHFNTGSCNACDIEIIAALTPRFDLERLGVQLKGTPRHCDISINISGDLSSEQITVLDKVAAACPVRRAIETGIEFGEQITRIPGAPLAA